MYGGHAPNSSSSTSSSTDSDTSPSPGSFLSISALASMDTKGQTASIVDYSLLCSYKPIGDNIDKHVKPREMSIDSEAQSLLYFNSYAIRDRLPITGLEDNPSFLDFT